MRELVLRHIVGLHDFSQVRDWKEKEESATLGESLSEDTGEGSIYGYEPIHGDEVFDWIVAFCCGQFLFEVDCGPVEKASGVVSEWMESLIIGQILRKYRSALSDAEMDEFEKCLAKQASSSERADAIETV